MMTTEMIGVAALVLLVYRAIEVLARANMKQRLIRGDVGNTVEVDADKATEAWEKKAWKITTSTISAISPPAARRRRRAQPARARRGSLMRANHGS